jgi:hypothetical protein
VDVVAMKPPSSDEVVAWVAASCEEQGVEVKVTAPEVVRKVATLLGEGRRPVEVRDARSE